MLGKYRIVRELGRGGMGVVLAAHHLHLDEPIAIKFLLPELAQDQSLVSRFLREGQASIKIRSEHVVRVLDVATMPGGTPFMVMEYLDGTDLQVLLTQQGPLAYDVAVDYLLQALEALAEAHALGMVHRDLKPANLFVVRLRDGSPCVKVLDFGITKVTSATDLGMTKTNAVMGSPRYMSPEQMRSSRGVDARTDIWALGTVLHELLTGNPPFDGGTMPELLAAILQDPPPPLTRIRPDAPPDLERIIMRCLEKDPAGRFQNVAELAHALAPFGPHTARATLERIERVLKVRGAMSSVSSAAFTMPHGAQSMAPAASVTNAHAGHGSATGSTTNAWGTTGTTTARTPWGLIVGLAGGFGLMILLVGAFFVFRQRAPAATAGTGSSVASATTAIPTSAPTVAEIAPLPTVDAIPSASATVPIASSSATIAATTKPTSVAATDRRVPVATKGTATTKPVTTKPGNDLFDGRR
jgi:serine/threonine-protein kinase